MYKILIAAILFTACNNVANTNQGTAFTMVDSLNTAQRIDSTTNNLIKNVLFDTTGISTAPIQVLSAKLVGREYSNYKDIRLAWKNVSNKKVAAVRFYWYGLNAFGEPADMGGHIQKGFGGGYMDRSLAPGKTDAGTWEIMSGDGKKVVLAWPYEVAFEDGSKWSTKQ